MQTDEIFMSLGHILVPLKTMRAMSLGQTDTFTFCIKIPVNHGINIETDDIFMSPGHISVPAHNMGNMSLGHTDTYTLFHHSMYILPLRLRLMIFSCPQDIY